MTPSKGCDVLRLKGSLYGMKQSGRYGSDWGLQVRRKSGARKPTIIFLSYVNDLIIVAPEKEEIDGIFGALGTERDIATTEVTQVLGIKIARNRSAKTFHISFPKNIDELTEKFPTNLREQNVCLNPHSLARELARGQHKDESPAAPLTPYQEIVGSLQWIASTVRADIAESLAASAEGDGVSGAEEARKLRLGGNDTAEALEGWVDADPAGCLDTRRSTSGYVFKAYGSVVDWQSKRQAVTARSTLESEYVAMLEAGKHAAYLRRLMEGSANTSRDHRYVLRDRLDLEEALPSVSPGVDGRPKTQVEMGPNRSMISLLRSVGTGDRPNRDTTMSEAGWRSAL
ncbi:hypothetical protein I350_07999 [Cryptococcus amylolentus CBS 6273]|uniref:Reverse transcriptase Ty1/copia-type domain-containing protein n=1 Tax=Cryptococcus amylolentus CBS 6273 TaxID=1296118 RepID=A0A1E3JAS5_9TREE|nr:hypothetical protein I350_07999 [Cryptococcus amylolentus CBS 6273]